MRPVKWNVAAAFFADKDAVWLDDFIQDDGLVFTKIHPVRHNNHWHLKPGSKTTLGMWWDHFAQARQAFKGDPDGIITCFPQLAICCALIRKLRVFGQARPRLIAYNFNLGGLSDGPRRKLAMWVAGQIEKFIVHSPSEVGPYARYLGVPEHKVVFIPLQRGAPSVVRAEDKTSPFILSMGSAGRDYESLVAVVRDLNIPTVIVTRADIAAGLPASDTITYLSGLSAAECMDLLCRCRLSVTPVKNLTSASGQITFINAMRLGVPTVATECPGTQGYIDHDETGMLVRPFDKDDLKDTIARLWSDPDLRDRIGKAGREKAEEHFSDERVAARLQQVLHAAILPPR